MEVSLTSDDVRLAASFEGKWEAIRACGEFLVERGYVTPDYIDFMYERERQTTTYVGNDVAIPHSTLAGREHILRSGVVVIQVPKGVAFGEATARVLVGIAGAGDEHIEVLAALAQVLSDMTRVDRIATAATREELLEALRPTEDA